MKKTIVILGMHRSGTSIIAKILHHTGVSMGEKMLGEDYSNPTGHYEDIDFYHLNDEILESAKGNWLFPPNKAKIVEQSDLFKDKIVSLIKNKKKKKLWGWKDPRTCLTIDLYAPYLDNPHFIICQRDPKDIAESLKRRQNVYIKHGVELTYIYNNSIHEFFAKKKSLPILNIGHNSLINNTRSILQKILSFIGIQVNDYEMNDLIKLVHTKDKMNELIQNARSAKPENKLKKKILPLYRFIQFYLWKIKR